MNQIITYIKKDQKQFYATIVLLIWSLGIFTLLPVFFFVRGLVISHTIKDSLHALAKYEAHKDAVNVPSEERLQYLSAKTNELKDIYLSLIPHLNEHAHYKPTEGTNAALEFKETLFAKKQELQKKAKKSGIPFPQEYGLNEYETRLPAPADVPQLFFHLAIAENILDILFSSEVLSIENISFIDVLKTKFSPKDSTYYKNYSLEISFETTYESLSNTLLEIAHSSFLYTIDALDIAPADVKADNPKESILSAKITLSVFALLPNENKD